MQQSNQFISELLALISSVESGQPAGGIKLARIIKRLTEMEVAEGGPYSLKSDQEKLDLGLNLSIAYFLGLQDIRLPKLDEFLDKELREAKEPFRSEIDDLTISSLINKYRALAGKVGNDAPVKEPIAYDENEQRILGMIREKFNKRFASFSPELRQSASAAIEKTIRSNRDKQMSLMAYYTKIALGKNGESIPDDLVADIGLANVFFWTAFVIYDDFWDQDEAADPRLLPIANIFARHYIDFFVGLSEDQEFRSFFHGLMDKLDASNAWEIENCRARVEKNIFHIPSKLPDFGDYEIKYRPASGHILSTVAILTKFGEGLKTADWGNIVSYFKHYLIAMQLNDDAHDWEEDMRRGHLSTVVTILLNDLRKNSWEEQTINLDKDIQEIRKTFWFITMPQYVKIVLAQTEASRKALYSISIVENPEPLERIIKATENVARQAEKEGADADAMLGEYREIAA